MPHLKCTIMPEYAASELIVNKDGSIYHLSLKPQNICDTIIVVGDPGRVHRISQFFDSLDFEMNKREFITHVGKINGKKLMVMSTGMGIDNIEIALTELDALANIDFKSMQPKARRRKLKIIRVGTSGAVQEDIPVGSHLVSEYAVGFDNIMSFYELPQDEFESSFSKSLRQYLDVDIPIYTSKCSPGLLSTVGEGMIRGFTVTSPGFYAPQGRQIRLPIRYAKLVDKMVTFHQNGHWLTNFEMETSGLYALGSMMGHEMLSTNAIIANRASGTFSKDPYKVVDLLIKKVLDQLGY